MAVQKGRVTVANFGLSYDTLEGPLEAVSDASIGVEPGEFICIIGPSGCGKSTLKCSRGLSQANPRHGRG